MKKSRLLGSACVCVLVLLGFNTATHAATINFGPVSGSGSDSFSFSGDGSGIVDLSIGMNLQQFDPALGTLTGVEITLEFVTQNVSSSITNNGTTTIASFEGGQSAITSFLAPEFGIDIGVADGFIENDFAPSASIPNPNGGLIDIQGTYAAFTLSPYIGTGTVTATFTHGGLVSISNCTPFTACADLDTIGSLSATVSSTVTYTFDEAVVPVPAAVWLFGSGLLGLVGMARRKKAA